MPGNAWNEDHRAGYDYEHQAWVEDGRYVRCGHPEDMGCQCYGKAHEGEPASQAACTVCGAVLPVAEGIM